jgi:putative transposase
MKGRYAGRRMTIYGTIMPGAVSIANWASKVHPLTEAAKKRLKILDWHRSHDKNISLTARRFGLTRKTVRNWQKRFDHFGIVGLNEQSRRPRNVRQPITPWPIVAETVSLKRQYPAWSKYKIQVLLKRKGLETSASTVGRIFRRKSLISKRVSLKKRRAALHPRARFPRGLRISRPGDMVQMDTRHVNLIEGRKIYQFTAIDVLTKQRVLRYYSSLASRNGADFLNNCLTEFPFKIKAIQTDNGPEFLKEFNKLCEKRKLPHYFIYPRTPKQNTYVENSHGSDKTEFYQQGNVCSDTEVMQARLKQWQGVWNEIRPHEALNYLTPKEYFLKWQQGRLPTKDTITLQT